MNDDRNIRDMYFSAKENMIQKKSQLLAELPLAGTTRRQLSEVLEGLLTMIEYLDEKTGDWPEDEGGQDET